MRYLATALAYVVGLILVATAVSLAVLYLVGPHGGLLPRTYYGPAVALGWILVIVLPVMFARWMWRRLRPAS